jgi:excisionase family DNA binding protein
MEKHDDGWHHTFVFTQPGTITTSATPWTKPALLVDLIEASQILGIPVAAVRRLIAEDRLPAIRAGRGGKFWIARTALDKFAERIR